MNEEQSIYSKQTKQGKEIPEYATHGNLYDYYLTDKASHIRHTQFPNNKEKEKGVATSLLAVAHCWPLASFGSQRHVFSVRTCSP